MVSIGLSFTTLNSSRCALVAWGSGISTVTGLGLFIEGFGSSNGVGSSAGSGVGSSAGSSTGSSVDSEDSSVFLVSGSCSIFVGPVGP